MSPENTTIRDGILRAVGLDRPIWPTASWSLAARSTAR